MSKTITKKLKFHLEIAIAVTALDKMLPYFLILLSNENHSHVE